jgi:hypothetical protein
MNLVQQLSPIVHTLGGSTSLLGLWCGIVALATLVFLVHLAFGVQVQGAGRRRAGLHQHPAIWQQVFTTRRPQGPRHCPERHAHDRR